MVGLKRFKHHKLGKVVKMLLDRIVAALGNVYRHVYTVNSG